ncbi:MAG TPA: hypothetical protein PK223_00265 [Bacillota bacterium]|nr:hypothetical protein [Bacillota bacterium]
MLYIIEGECGVTEACITLRKRQYSIATHTDYDFDRPILICLWKSSDGAKRPSMARDT